MEELNKGILVEEEKGNAELVDDTVAEASGGAMRPSGRWVCPSCHIINNRATICRGCGRHI